MRRETKSTALARGFPPIVAPDARVLVLGSMPSVASLAKQQYYGHDRNAFWPIMGSLFGAFPELAYDERGRILRKNRVALWDVLRSCYREGSLDAAIRAESEVPNDFLGFFDEHHDIEAVFFNGGKAEAAFERHVLPTVPEAADRFRFQRLPSTSPAHAGRTFEQKLAAWQVVKDALQRRCVDA